MKDLRLREVRPEDLSIFFRHQCDAEANRMAAFTHKDPSNRVAFDAHWGRILADTSVFNRTVVCGEEVVGNVAAYVLENEWHVCYWIGREFWGRGFASAALRLLLEIVPVRPLHASAVWDNLGSIRVLEKCGFRACGSEMSHANGRDEIVEERFFILEADTSG